MTDYPNEGNGEAFKTINPIWASISKAFFEKSSELQGAYLLCRQLDCTGHILAQNVIDIAHKRKGGGSFLMKRSACLFISAQRSVRTYSEGVMPATVRN